VRQPRHAVTDDSVCPLFAALLDAGLLQTATSPMWPDPKPRSPAQLCVQAHGRTRRREVPNKRVCNNCGSRMSDAHANNNASRNLRTVGSTHAPTRCAAQASNECMVTEGPRRQHLSPKVARWRGQIRSTCPRTADQKPVLWIGQRVQSSALRCSQPRILVSKSCSDSVCILGSEHVNATSHKFRGVPIKTLLSRKRRRHALPCTGQHMAKSIGAPAFHRGLVKAYAQHVASSDKCFSERLVPWSKHPRLQPQARSREEKMGY
jgi:hypothetical protein